MRDIQPTSYSMGKTKSFPTTIRKKRQGCSLLPVLLIIVLEVLAIADKKKKGIQIRKGKAKLSLFADDMIVYMENPIHSTKKTYST